MSRILYVEDKLEQYKDMILEMFDPILTSKKKEELDRFYNPRPENIVKWCEDIPLLDICYTFTSALRKILTGHEKYQLVIIDRNLEAYGIEDNLEEIEQLLKDNDLPKYKSYCDDYRSIETIYQGDILFQILLEKNPKSIDRIFFLTENLKDQFQVKHHLRHEWERLKYDQSRVIGKDVNSLKAITDEVKKLDSIERLRLHPEVVAILKNLHEDCLKSFECILEFSDSLTDVSALSGELRNLFLNVMDKLAHVIEKDIMLRKRLSSAYERAENKADGDVQSKHQRNKRFKKFYFWKKIGIKELKVSDMLNAFNYLQEENDNTFKFYSNIKFACWYIYRVCSDIGDHKASQGIPVEKFRPKDTTKYTIHNLVNLLCEVVLWYGRLLKQFEKS